MAVRTARLASGDSAPASTPKVIYTCPSGVTAIVKDIRMDPGGSNSSRAAVQASLSGLGFMSLTDGPITALQPRSVQGFIVLEPGDQLRLYSEGSTFSCIISGAELAGVAP